MNFDQSRELFLEEARELLAKAEAALLLLEDQPTDLDLINEVFRGLHTIKGSGAMFGFTAVSEFTHRIESLFDEVRKGRQPVTPDIVEIGLQAADHISRLLENRGDPSVADQIFLGIDHLSLGPSAPVTFAPTRPALPVSPPAGRRRWRITFRPQPTILHRGVRLESLLLELAELGTLATEVITELVPPLEALEPTELNLSWILNLETAAGLAEIRQCFLFVEDYAELTFEEDQSATIPAPEPSPAPPPSPEPPPPPEPKAPVPKSAPKVDADPKLESASVRVRKEKLDTLIDTVGELVILQARLEQEARKDTEGTLLAITETLGRLTADLRDTTMSIRMVPLEELFGGFQRLVRDLAKALGKEVVLEVSGASTELDKNIIESIKDPLLHIIRNSVDHGIELPEVRAQASKPRRGTVTLLARQAGSRVEIEVGDDGAGLNLPKIRDKAVAANLLPPGETNESRIMAMIFEPGFSTADKTTDVSGRGVGMDVVKRNIEKLRGEVSLRSQFGQGTTITLSIPLTLVIIEGLLVRVGDSDYVISLAQVQECVDLTPDIQVGTGGRAMIDLRGKTIPTLALRETLGVPGTFDGVSRLVIVQSDGDTIGLVVDAVMGRKQVVIKPLSSVLRRMKVLSGATILGDGSVALILDVAEIVKAKLGEPGPESPKTGF